MHIMPIRHTHEPGAVRFVHNLHAAARRQAAVLHTAPLLVVHEAQAIAAGDGVNAGVRQLVQLLAIQQCGAAEDDCSFKEVGERV